MPNSRILQCELVRRQERLEVRLIHLDHESLQQQIVSSSEMIVSVILYGLDKALRAEPELVFHLTDYLHVDII